MNVISFIKSFIDGVKAFKKMDWFQRGEVLAYAAAAGCAAYHLRNDAQDAGMSAAVTFVAACKQANQPVPGTIALPSDHPAAMLAKHIVEQAKENSIAETEHWDAFKGQ